MLGERFTWEIVLQYDRKNRELQASLKFEWGVDFAHLHQVALREKLMSAVNRFNHDAKRKSRTNARQQQK